MAEYNTINAKLTNLQLSKLKTALKNNEGTTLRLSNKKLNKEQLPHELFLTQKQVTKLRKSINNNMSTNIKLSKAQIKKIIISGNSLGSILVRFIPKLIKPAISVVRNIWAPLGLSAAISGINDAIQKKIHSTGITVKFSNKEINGIVKIVKALEDSDVLMKGVSETLKNDAKKLHSQKGGALPLIPMLLGTLGVSLLSGKGLFRAGSGKCNCGQGMYRAGQNQGKDLFRAGQGIKKIINASTSFNKLEIIDYFKNELNVIPLKQ